jgi:putative zinc finger/helix-turn-helix YgiT family protein
MNCLSCGKEMEVRREKRRYDIGLDEPITLEEVEVAHCPNCGEECVSVSRPEDLHRYVALRVASKKERLTPKEIRFLRTHLGYSSSDFAKVMSVEPATVSRWERVAKPQDLGNVAERLLRVLVLTNKPRERYPLEELGSAEASPIKIRMLPLHERWVASDDVDGEIPKPWGQAEVAGYEFASTEQVDAEPLDSPCPIAPIEPTITERVA